jgi:regulator of protease activity HflC (stomatin/prohibitin superfamily)
MQPSYFTPQRIIAYAVTAVAGLFALIVAFSSFFTVSQGYRAVLTTNGSVVGNYGPGLHFKMPIFQGANDISVQPQKIVYGSSDNPIAAYSYDQQPAKIRLSVNYHVIDVEGLYSSYGDIDTGVAKLLEPRVYEVLKNVFGQYEAASAIQKRAKFNADVTRTLQATVKGTPIIVDSVQIEDIEFSDTYEKAVEARMEATVRQQQAEAQKAKRIIDADAAAYEVRAAADAKAHQTEVMGNAEAGAIKARGDALRENPELPTLVAAEKWDGKLPQTMIPGGTLPFLDIQHK